MGKAKPTELNFKGVSTSGRRVWVPEGDYLIRGKSVEETESKRTQNPMWVFRWEFVNGPKQGQEIIDRLVLVPQSLFRLRNLLEALGIKVPEGKLTVDPQKIVKLTKKRPIGAQIVDDDAYEGHIPSTIKRYIPADDAGEPPEGGDEDLDDDEEIDEEEWEDDLDDLEDDDDEEEEDDEDEEDDEEEDEEEDEEDEEDEDDEESETYTEAELRDLDISELKEVARDLGCDMRELKGKKSPSYRSAILAAQEAAGLDDEEEDDEEEEEEPEPPKKKLKKKPAKKAAKKKQSVADELEDLDLDDLD